MVSTPLVALVSALGGALIAGGWQAFLARYASFKESKTVAASIRAELTALQEIVQRREYVAVLDAIIARLNDPAHAQTRNDIFDIAVTQDYFQVFNAHCARLGLLGDAAAPVVVVYTILKAGVEDIHTLNRIAAQGSAPDRAQLLNFTIDLRATLDAFRTRGADAIKSLRRFEKRRYLGCVS